MMTNIKANKTNDNIQRSLVLPHLQCCNICNRLIKLDNIQLNLTSCKHHLCDDCLLSYVDNQCPYCKTECIIIPVKNIPKHLKCLYEIPYKLFTKYNQIIDFHQNQFRLFSTRQQDLALHQERLNKIKAHNSILEKMCNKLTEKIKTSEAYIGEYLASKKKTTKKR